MKLRLSVLAGGIPQPSLRKKLPSLLERRLKMNEGDNTTTTDDKTNAHRDARSMSLSVISPWTKSTLDPKAGTE